MTTPLSPLEKEVVRLPDGRRLTFYPLPAAPPVPPPAPPPRPQGQEG